MCMCDLRVQSTRYKNLGVSLQYARTILMTKFTSRALYAIPRVRVQSEVYFGLQGVPSRIVTYRTVLTRTTQWKRAIIGTYYYLRVVICTLKVYVALPIRVKKGTKILFRWQAVVHQNVQFWPPFFCIKPIHQQQFLKPQKNLLCVWPSHKNV